MFSAYGVLPFRGDPTVIGVFTGDVSILFTPDSGALAPSVHFWYFTSNFSFSSSCGIR